VSGLNEKRHPSTFPLAPPVESRAPLFRDEPPMPFAEYQTRIEDVRRRLQQAKVSL